MVSLVVTVLNERHTILDLLKSVSQQTQKPDEVVIVDGGSEDGTRTVLALQKYFNVTIVYAPYCNIKHTPSPVAAGRNIGIAKAKGDWIIVTDAGCKLHPRFIEEMCKEGVDVVGGWTQMTGGNFIQRIAALLLEAKSGDYPPSRCIAFSKAIWEKVGGYPEIALTGEDTAFNEKLKQSGARYRFNPDAIVEWLPPNSLRKILKQLYRYGKGDALSKLAGRMYGKKLIKIL